MKISEKASPTRKPVRRIASEKVRFDYGWFLGKVRTIAGVSVWDKLSRTPSPSIIKPYPGQLSGTYIAIFVFYCLTILTVSYF